MARSGVVVILFCYFQISMTKYVKDDSPEECKRYGICANVEDYPTELARKLIAELKAQNTIFNVDEPLEEPTFTLQKFRRASKHYKLKGPINSIESRFSLDENLKGYKSLCKTILKSLPPRYARHKSGKFKLILNDDVPSQVFNIGLCPDSSGQRDDISKFCQSETMLTGYEGQCIQKTRLQEMYYIEGNQTARGYFHIPTCCSCDFIPIKLFNR